MKVFKRNIIPPKRIVDIRRKVGNLLFIVKKSSKGETIMIHKAKIKTVATKYIGISGNTKPPRLDNTKYTINIKTKRDLNVFFMAVFLHHFIPKLYHKPPRQNKTYIWGQAPVHQYLIKKQYHMSYGKKKASLKTKFLLSRL